MGFLLPTDSTLPLIVPWRWALDGKIPVSSAGTQLPKLGARPAKKNGHDVACVGRADQYQGQKGIATMRAERKPLAALLFKLKPVGCKR